MNSKVLMVLRILLSLPYIVFGLNFFFHFIPMPPMSGDSAAFMGIFFGSGWMTFIKVLEVVCGLALVSNQYSRLAAIAILPVTINILLFHSLVAGNPGMGIAMLLLNISVLYGYKDDFKGAFKRN
jgi:putative oxidoreductase